MTGDWAIEFLLQTNEVLTSATVIVAVSMLLYNLSHGPRDPVARASSVLLGCVSINYIGDVLVALNRAPGSIEAWLRIGWIGIALAPAALFHLSSALLATTGLISRGRRRRVVRLLYLIGAVFIVAGAFTDLVIHSLVREPIPLMNPGPMFALYFVYFVLASGFAFNNVLRARRRCLTRATHRRMTYLLFALITPVAGIFPYSLLFTHPPQENPFGVLFLINLGNLAIVLMLAFMAYPLSFFGPRKPDRAIKADLLSFMLRGPVTGIAVLVVVMFTPRLTGIGIPGRELVPFFSVATVLALQWSFTVIIPFLERRLIYTADQEQARQLQELGAHLLTEADARQLLEGTLAAICDYLRVPSAFAASIGPEGVRMEQSVGPLVPLPDQLAAPEFLALLPTNGKSNGHDESLAPHARSATIIAWQSFWLVPLTGTSSAASYGRLVGVMGIWARSPIPDLLPEEEKVFRVLYTRVGRVLEDMRLQADLFARVEDILQEASVERAVEESVRFGNASQLARLARAASVVEQPDFVDLIREALRDYWGGPRLTDERLIQLTATQSLLAENENNPAKAARALLNRALERLKPEGQRSLTMAEWTLYNIIDLRFVQSKKVREVSRQLAMSEADLYRKQRIAIEKVAQEVAALEYRAREEAVAATTDAPGSSSPIPLPAPASGSG